MAQSRTNPKRKAKVLRYAAKDRHNQKVLKQLKRDMALGGGPTLYDSLGWRGQMVYRSVRNQLLF